MLVKNPYKFTSKYLLTNQIDALDVIQSTQFEQRIETFLLRLSNFLLKLQKFDDLQKKFFMDLNRKTLTYEKFADFN